MQYSRLRKYEEKKQEKKIAISIIGIVAIFIFLGIFGIKILVGFSLLVDKLRGTPQQQISQQFLLPPDFDPLPIATNSATIAVSGKGQPGMTVIVYINETDTEKTTVDKDGSFTIPVVKLIEGSNTISAKQTDDKKNVSALSEVFTVVSKKSKPTLDISYPSDNQQIRQDQNTIIVTGKTNDETNTITVNDRLVIVRSDGSFSYELNVPDGDSTVKVIATDTAGNQITVERKINYGK
ncbi:MAG: hypothetical protein ACD_48C00089G0002 [uncultured bacterium]|nr:MAG: hypothetical protein ACD_48C00089G0002 [uncultured bacterium]